MQGSATTREGNTALDHIAVHEAERPLHLVAGAGAAETGDVGTVVRDALADMKAIDIVEIDLVGRTSIADAMVIASGTSARHVGSIAERIIGRLKDRGFGRVRVEGMPSCDWVLIDAGDLIVHLFRPEVRAFYNLEKMWGADRPVERSAG